jgi:hypothetical protein
LVDAWETTGRTEGDVRVELRILLDRFIGEDETLA